jgi:1-phosphatidylinositol-3-phosphate 5-kinase
MPYYKQWWGKKWHALPGGSIIVWEDDWGSIIVFTLRWGLLSFRVSMADLCWSVSTTDYHRELSSVLVNWTSSSSSSFSISTTPQSQLPTVAIPDTLMTSSFFYKIFSNSKHTPDPDQEDVAWSKPEPFSAVISRKELLKDLMTLLAFREVPHQKSPMDAFGSGILAAMSQFAGGGTGTSTSARGTGGVSPPRADVGGVHVPPSAWAKPDVQVSMDAVGGQVSAMTTEAAGRILHEIEDGVGVGARWWGWCDWCDWGGAAASVKGGKAVDHMMLKKESDREGEMVFEARVDDAEMLQAGHVQVFIM